MQLDTHYPRIASSKLKLTVCGALCAGEEAYPIWGLGLVGINDGNGAEELRKALPLI